MMSIRLTDTAVLRPLELPARVGAGPTPTIRRYAEVRNASLLETTGRDDDAFGAQELLAMLYSTADRERRQWYVELDGELVGCCALDILQDDGGETAMVNLALLRRVWDHGIGSAVYAQVEAVARDAGVRRLQHWSGHTDTGTALPVLDSPTGFGAIPMDHSARFLTRNGFRLEQVERASALTWSDATTAHLEALRADANAHAVGYRIVQWSIPTPSEHLDGYAWMKSRMSTDAPDGDLGTPEEAWDHARVRRQDERLARRGWTMTVTAAQHVETGELCAFNELAIGADHARGTHQYDTLVLSAHRGHRLGMLVKTAGLLAWRDSHPLSPKVITYNAEENRPMLDINEAIGFAPVAYEGAWKKVLT
jgi:GNAT superfamily N-acetyltransferase